MFSELRHLFKFELSSNCHLYIYMLRSCPGNHARFVLFCTLSQKEFSKSNYSNIVAIKKKGKRSSAAVKQTPLNDSQCMS